MHGWRLRLQQEEDLVRDRNFEGRSPKQQRELLCGELRAVLAMWEGLASYLTTYKGTRREIHMAEHLLQWRARKIVHLIEKWEGLVYM